MAEKRVSVRLAAVGPGVGRLGEDVLAHRDHAARRLCVQPDVVLDEVRLELEVVVPAELQEEVVQAILASARTGEPGDGKVFVEPIADVLRIRTGERGQDAV